MVTNREVMDAFQAEVFSKIQPPTFWEQFGAAAFAIIGLGLVAWWFVYSARKIIRETED